MSSEGKKQSAFRECVDAELAHAYAKHGRDPWSRHEFWGVLDEEVEELKEAIRQDLPTEAVLKEAMQIACVCQRYAETGDRYRGDHPSLAAREFLEGREKSPPPDAGQWPSDVVRAWESADGSGRWRQLESGEVENEHGKGWCSASTTLKQLEDGWSDYGARVRLIYTRQAPNSCSPSSSPPPNVNATS